MTGHNYETVSIREASCTQSGLTLHLCKSCGDFYTETTPTGSHHYHTKTVNPTCQSVGYIEHTCDVCGDTYITDIQPLVSHSFERVTKAPTCTDKGYTTSTCAVCGFSYVSDYTEATGHTWDEGHTVTSSTCEGEGVIEYHCQNCDEKMIKSTSANGHRPGTAATCTEPQVCEDCGTILELPKGHSYESTVIAPTCTAMGYTIFKCKDCDDTYTGDFTDKVSHHYHTVVTQPTCTSSGYTTYTCQDCGDEYVSDYTDKTPHNFKAVVTAPTCTEFGFTTYTCEDCGESYVSDYTDKTPHNYNKQVVAPTCTEHGYTVYTCPDCGNEYIGDITDCEQHNYKETVIPPTCTEMGYSVFTCESCGDEYKGNYTDKLPHNYNAVVTNPTCTEFGFTTYTCVNCDDSYVSDYTDKLDHDYDIEVTAPTCTEFGFSTYTCKNCGHSYVDDHTDKIAHSYKADVTAPTCTTMGFTTYTCKDCGNSYVADYTDMLGHTLSDWIVDNDATIEHSGEKHIECTVCGEVLNSAEIPQLADTDRTDEDGNAEVGKYAILKNKERLLSFDEPTRFIFSHSALREGWDNPNVFQICTLKHSDSQTQKRQEVGRGLRLCVNQDGNRMDIDTLAERIHDINKLTVVASESYQGFVSDLQKDIRTVLYDRPTTATSEYFKGKYVKVDGTPTIIDDKIANTIEFYLIQNGYVDMDRKITDKYREAVDTGSLAELPADLQPMREGIHTLIQSVYDETALDRMFENGKQTTVTENNLNENFKKKEFQELWRQINHKYAYTVEFKSEELIQKAIESINEKLYVSQLTYTLSKGEQTDEMDINALDRGDAFKSAKTRSKAVKRAGVSQVKYDVIGKIAEGTVLTRRTVAEILSKISPQKFYMFKANPEEFISKVTRLINEQKATMIVDHITYHQIEGKYEDEVFTAEKPKESFDKAFKANKHIQDYVFTDGSADKSIERVFAEDLDNADEVCVYAKLPRGFHIPTPVGNYSPDWAIAFYEGTVKHIYFVAETKGSMSSMDFRPIEDAKIECAKKLFNEFSTEKVKYHEVDSYDKLLAVMNTL